MSISNQKNLKDEKYKPVDVLVWTDIDSLTSLDGIRVHVLKRQDGLFIKRIVEWHDTIAERNYYLRPTPQANRLHKVENAKNLPTRYSFLQTLKDPPSVDVIENMVPRVPTGDWKDSDLDEYEKELAAEALRTGTHIAKIDKLYSHNGINDLFWGIVNNLKVASLWIEQFGSETMVSGFAGKLLEMAPLTDSANDGFDKCLFGDSQANPATLRYWRTDEDWINNPSNYLLDEEGTKELQPQQLDITETTYGKLLQPTTEQQNSTTGPESEVQRLVQSTDLVLASLAHIAPKIEQTAENVEFITKHHKKSQERRAKSAKKAVEDNYGNERGGSKDDKTELAVQEVRRLFKANKGTISHICKLVCKPNNPYKPDIKPPSLMKSYYRTYGPKKMDK